MFEETAWLARLHCDYIMGENKLKKFVLLEVGDENTLMVEQSTCILLKENEIFSYHNQYVVQLKNFSSTAKNKRKKTYKATVLLFHGNLIINQWILLK